MNLTRHDGVPRAARLREGDHFSELAHAHPLGFLDELREFGVGFVGERSDRDPRHAR